MKKILIMFFIILVCLFNGIIIYQVNNVETVLLVGKIMGFDIEAETQEQENGSLVPISSQKLGTVTFIKKGTHEFAALGHSALSNNQELNVEGFCHEINLYNIEKSSNNYIGRIRGTLKDEVQIGSINKNSEKGVFGVINEVKENEYREIKTANRYEIVTGEAGLMISLENEGLQKYKVEIIDINYLSDSKNIKIKIKDKNLISKTGGIVQGMSGAPIVQNGKLIGAINYVDVNAPEEAYAIFIDKLI